MRILGKTKKLFGKHRVVQHCFAFATLGLLTLSAAANPSEPTVRHGQIQFTPGTQAQIQQLTDRAIVDWTSFSIGAGEAVRILQPSTLSVILNRVTGADPSTILGNLSANGNVFLINPNGIVFGPGSVVNVGGLVASSLALSDESFLSGRYTFTRPDGVDLGAVVNQGRITVSPAGYAVLTGPAVLNQGTIVARAGKVVLAAGEHATLDLEGRDLIHFALGGTPSEGTVLLGPGMMSEAIATSLGVAPGRQANQLVRDQDGSVRLVSSGTLAHSGKIDVDGVGGSGGSVLLVSDDLTVLTNGSVISASGDGTGAEGGEVRVLSDMSRNAPQQGYTHLESGSSLIVRGGESAQGGFLEVSGKRVNFLGDFDLSSVGGVGGRLILDPQTVKIIDGIDPLQMRDSETMIIGDEWFELFNTASDFTLASSGQILVDLSDPGTAANGDSVVNFARGASNTTIRLLAGVAPGVGDTGNIDLGTGYAFQGIDELHIDTPGSVSFGDSVVSIVGALEVDVDGDIDFGSSSITQLTRTGGTSNIIDAGGDIRFGTSNIFLDQVFFTFDNVDTTITAGGGISSGAGDNLAGSYTASLSVGGDITMSAGTGNIVLHDLDLQTPASLSGDNIAVTATNGLIDLGESRVLAGGSLTITAAQSLTMTAADLRSEIDGMTLTAGGDITFGDSTVNTVTVPAVGSSTTGFLTIESTGGGIDFGDTDVRVAPGGSGGVSSPFDFDVTAADDIDFSSATFDITTRGSTTNEFISTGGSILFGTSQFNTNSTDAAGHSLVFSANGIITGVSSPDGNRTTYSNKLNIDGGVSFTAGTGDIALLDADIVGAQNIDIVLAALNGTIALGESRLLSDQALNVTAGGALSMTGADLRSVTAGIALVAGGDMTFGNSTMNLVTGPVAVSGTTGSFTVTSNSGSVNFGDSDIRVFAGGSGGGTSTFDFDVTAPGDIIFSDVDLDLTTRGSTNNEITSTAGSIALGTSRFLTNTTDSSGHNLIFTADRSISSSLTDPSTLTVEGDLTMRTRSGDISLANTEISTTKSGFIDLGAVERDVANNPIGGGSVILPKKMITTDLINVVAWQDVSTNGSEIEHRSDSTFQAVTGDLRLGDSLINQQPGNATTNHLSLIAGDEIVLGRAAIRIAGTFNDDVDFSAVGNINLGAAIIETTTWGTVLQILSSDGGVDLGSSRITTNITSSGGDASLQVTALGDIMAGPAGNSLSVNGAIQLVSNGGSVTLPNVDLDINRGGNNLTVQAAGGSVDLGQSSLMGTDAATFQAQGPNGSITLTSANLDFDENIRFEAANGDVSLGNGNIVATDAGSDVLVFAGGVLDASSVTLTVPDRLGLYANGRLQALGSAVGAPDLEIFGFNPSTLTPDPTRPLAQGVTLDLFSAGNIDLSVYATGDIAITHSGGGSITAERLGLEGNGTTASPGSVQSVSGEVTLVSDGTINLGKGTGDRGAALVSSGAAKAVTIQAALINSRPSGTVTLDAQSGGTVRIVGPTSAEALEVSAPGVTVDLSGSANSSARVNIVGDSDYLEVAGNRSDIEVTELASANKLTVKPQTSDFVLTIDPLGIEGILYTDEGDIALGSINTSAGQVLAVRTANAGNITAAPTGFNLNAMGDLLLDAGGNVGTAGAAISLPGGRTSIVAGGSINVQTSAASLTSARVELIDPLGQQQALGTGFAAGTDLTVRMTGTGTTLNQDEDIRSNSGGVALDIDDGTIVQSSGSRIAGNVVALAVGGDAGTFDAGTANPLQIQADSLVVDGGSDVVVRQASGDLTVQGQATIGGTTYTTTGAVGDMRVAAENGALSVSSDLTVGGQTGLVSGTVLTVTAQALPNSVVLGGNITSGQNLVIVSDGDIAQTSGVLTAPAIGLGAKGSIGSTASTINIQTNDLALNPANGLVSDPDGFTQVPSVSAAGLTVNQGLAVTPTTPDPVTPPPVVPEVPTTGSEQYQVPLPVDIVEEFENSAFAQNDSDLVEDSLDELLLGDLESLLETDPTARPLGWFNDEDFLRKKFRR